MKLNASPRKEGGFLVIVMMVILAIMLMYVMIGLRSLNHLHQDLKLVERKQVQRLQPASLPVVLTNTPAVAP